MVARDSRTIGISAGIFAVAAILTISFLNTTQVTQAQSTTVPVTETYVKVSNIKNVESASSNPAAELGVEKDGFGVAFYAHNKHNTNAVIDVSKWEVLIRSLDGAVMFIDTVDTNQKKIIAPNERALLHKLDLTEHKGFFEVWPGTYIIELNGMSNGHYSIEKCGENECDTVVLDQGISYTAKSEVTITYDAQKIRENLGVLRADGMRAEVQGVGADRFTIKGDESKNLVFSLVNDKKERISALNSFAVEGFWPVANRSQVAGYNTYIDHGHDACKFLEPNETKDVAHYKLAANEWPLGGEGLAKQTEDGALAPGIYIAAIEVTTLPCMTSDGSSIEGGTHSMLFAFEVTS
ncbi:MAG: hypothetical protein HRF40_00560 [Nitrososphaera sp.]|jgi:hypothetical protein